MNDFLATVDDLDLARLKKLRAAMSQLDMPVMLIVDPVNIRYATGSSNMPIFSMRTPSRYLLLFADGPTILYDYLGCEHLSKDLPTIDQIRPALGLCFTSSNDRVSENATLLAVEVENIMTEYLSADKRLAIDRFPFAVADALRNRGIELKEADPIFYEARKTKLPLEVSCMREAMRRVDQATSKFEQSIEPGKTEVEVWAEFYRQFISDAGIYVTTRLMQSGERTFPYFQQCGESHLQEGDLVCLDTDALGYEGYAVDYSRTFFCGDRKPSDEQKTLYEKAFEQLEHNISIMSPGKTYEEIAEQAWPIAEQYQASRYYCLAHGLGMSGERPNIPYKVKDEPYSLEGVLESGMVICVESYIGSESVGQGVKLEEQLLITESGIERMSQYALGDQFL